MSVVSSCLFTFWVSTDTELTQVYPLNFTDTSIVEELEANQIFYRRKFNGTLTFGGRKLKNDFNFFWAVEQVDPCQRITLLIMRDSDIYWEGYFSTSNGEWNLDDCTFTVTPLRLDDYSDIYEFINKEFNIYDAGLTQVSTTLVDCAATYVYPYNYYLIDVIEYIIAQLEPGATVSSTFLNDANNPVTLTTNRYRYLTICQKSGIKRPSIGYGPSIGMLSFEALVEILRCMNLYWKYDATANVLTVEHVSFWSPAAGLDIRTQEMAYSTNKYKYTNDILPKYEKFSWMESSHEDFLGTDIYYDSLCVNQDSNANIAQLSVDVTTDIEYINSMCASDDTASVISDEGWVLLANEDRGVGGLYVYLNEAIINAGEVLYNMDLSWSVLHRNFFKHERQLIQGYMNGSLTTFFTCKKNKLQECSIKYNDLSFDASEYMTTELGETYLGGLKATVKTAKIRPYGQIDLTLLYGAADNANPGITYSRIIMVREVKQAGTDSIFYWQTSEPVDAALAADPLQIRLTTKDAGGNTCQGIWQVTVMNVGDRSGTIAIDWPEGCVAPWSDPPVCIDIYDYQGGATWVFRGKFDINSICP